MANFRWSDLEGFAKKNKMTLDQVVRRSVLDVSTQVIKRTPVDTGRARNNWQAAINRVPSGQLDGNDKSGAKAIAGANSASANAAGEVYYLVNNLPYIRKLEYGYSDQAPEGMVRLSIKDFEQIATAAIRSAKR